MTGGAWEKTDMANNPRYANGNTRRKYRERFKAMAAPCGICGGRLGRIHYEEPSDYKHPLSFVIDEIVPVSRYREAGYRTPAAAAEDWGNLQPAHYICNAKKGAKTAADMKRDKKCMMVNLSDGEW